MSHLKQPCFVMCFDVDSYVVESQVLVPGMVENIGSVNVNDVFENHCVGCTVNGAVGGKIDLLGSPMKTSATVQVLTSAPWN